MECRTHTLNKLKNYKFVVVISSYKGKIVLSRHKNRTTWETQGGHIETGENTLEAAKRELYEESGATIFTITPAFDYWTCDKIGEANGMVFIAEIKEFTSIPDSEMEEIAFFDELPSNLTYPEITPVLFLEAQNMKKVSL